MQRADITTEPIMSDSDHGDDRMRLRRTNKPAMEKKRRARINHCLAELKGILVQNRVTSSSHAKWEKADILEMTVDYVKKLLANNTSFEPCYDDKSEGSTSSKEASPDRSFQQSSASPLGSSTSSEAASASPTPSIDSAVPLKKRRYAQCAEPARPLPAPIAVQPPSLHHNPLLLNIMISQMMRQPVAQQHHEQACWRPF